ncbi:hypothetical protein Q7P37_006225 [Cladosporium fusiforme]
MFGVWSSTDPEEESTSPAAKRRRISESHTGRRSSKATRACDSCKAKKARCSGAKPCATCASKGVSCTYESQYLRGRPPTPPSSTPDTTGGEHHSDYPATRSSALSDPENQNNRFICGPGAVSGDNIGTEHDVTLSGTLSGSQYQSDKPNRAGPLRNAESQSGQSAARPAPLSSSSVGISSRSLSRSSPELDSAVLNGQYVDRTSALSFLRRARMKQFNADDTGPVKRSNQPLTAAGDKPLHGSTSTGLAVNPTILPRIPDIAEATELLDLYFDVCVATYKPLHRQTVNSWYDVVTANINQGLELADSLGNAKASVLLTVFAVATFHRQKSRGFSEDAPSLSQSDALFKCSMALTETETGGPHLESAQARLLQVFYLLMTCRMNQAWYIFGNVLQIISALGMHRRSRRDKLHSRSPSDYIHSQCRIRSFWSAYILDKYLGVVMGRPRHFHDKDIDQDLPDRVEDVDMLPTGPVQNEGDIVEECRVDGFIWNIKLARIVGEISDDLYPITPLSEDLRVEVARRLATKLGDWYDSLPALMKAKPTNLVRSFRRQCVALRLAYKHAVVHLYRPFLPNRSGSQTQQPNNDAQIFRRDSIKFCIGAARDALRTVDELAREGPLFHAFWWTHYVTFCALSVVYVWQMQSNNDSDGIDAGALMALAERCQTHLAQATARNSSSRRYSMILEELRSESRKQGPPDSRDVQVDGPAAGMDSTNGLAVNDAGLPGGFGQGGLSNNMPEEFQNPFMDWQTSDWLDLDASAYGVIPGFSPEFQWFGEI